MTETIVVESNNTVVTRAEQTTYIVTGIVGPPGPSGTILSNSDVNSSQLNDGGVLVYNASTNKFDVTTSLEKQIINAGFF